MKLRQRMLRAIGDDQVYEGALVVKLRPANPDAVRRVADQLVSDGALKVETGSWSGERIYHPTSRRGR